MAPDHRASRQMVRPSIFLSSSFFFATITIRSTTHKTRKAIPTSYHCNDDDEDNLPFLGCKDMTGKLSGLSIIDNIA
eukprot:scaffold139255_cov18-Prasinocladus_malaysianus.AAC.1